MKIEQWHRRHAVMLASQLSDSPDDALAVLDCVREIVVTFLHVDMPAKAQVVTLRAVPDLSA